MEDVTGARARWATPRTPARRTVGADVARMARLLGRPFVPWQRALSDVAGELTDAGRFAYPIVVAVVPRRAGKTIVTLATLCQRAQLARMARGWYTAQTHEDAAKVFRDEWAPLLTSSALGAKVRVRQSQGSEGFTFTNRVAVAGRPRASLSKVQLFAPGPKALHAQNADTVVVDEAWAFDTLTGEEVEAGARPAMLTRPLRQLWIVSAGGTELSTYLDGWMIRGRAAVDAGDRSGICYVEFSADPAAPGYDPADPDLWRHVHPALGFHIDVDAIADDFRLMGREAFERAVLNVWPRPSEGGAVGLDPHLWAAQADAGRAPGDPVVFSFAVAVDHSHAAIAVAGFTAGALVVELVERRRGTAWVAPALRAFRAAHRNAPIVADEMMGAPVAAELARHRVDYQTIGARTYAGACGAFVAELTEGRLWHRAQVDLDDAVAGAARRNLGDGWAWSRRTSSTDICALEAVTVAAWGRLSTPVPGRPEVARSR